VAVLAIMFTKIIGVLKVIARNMKRTSVIQSDAKLLADVITLLINYWGIHTSCQAGILLIGL
jgi:hypothetical protein